MNKPKPLLIAAVLTIGRYSHSSAASPATIILATHTARLLPNRIR